VTAFVALLRAVNVGGTGKLPMALLADFCTELGFRDVRTYIASGNVVFTTDRDEARVKAALGERLERYAGKPVGVVVRTADELAAVVRDNPFPEAPGNRAVAIFLDVAPPADAVAAAKHRGDEEIVLGTREIYVRYTDGMADSRLVIPAAKAGTARNLNTVAKLAAMAAALCDRG
jgi:uncharacterized protein (DUF1697 family)